MIRQRKVRSSKKQRVLEFAAARGWELIDEAEWHEIKATFPEVSESTLRESGLPLAPPWCGVAQHTIDDLEASLRRFSQVYAAKPHLRRYCREQVINAKVRARFASRSDKLDDDKRFLKAEMVDWMLVWLGDPALFPAWAAVRRERMEPAAG